LEFRLITWWTTSKEKKSEEHAENIAKKRSRQWERGWDE